MLLSLNIYLSKIVITLKFKNMFELMLNMIIISVIVKLKNKVMQIFLFLNNL